MKKIICFVFVSLFVFASSVNVQASSLESTSSKSSKYVVCPDGYYPVMSWYFDGRNTHLNLCANSNSSVSYKQLSSGMGHMFKDVYWHELDSNGSVYDSHFSPSWQFSESWFKETEFSYVNNTYNQLVKSDMGFSLMPALVGPVKMVEMGAVLKVVKEIAPIVVLSIVSFLGLRKAWLFCLSQLKSL